LIAILNTKEIIKKKKSIFRICNNHDESPWKILILIRKKREKKVERRWKKSRKKGGKKLEGLYVGEGFAFSIFHIFGP
jgi:hypothetical protein